MDGVPRPLADFGPDVLADADDVAGRLHPHKLPVVALSIKGGVDQHPPLTKGGFDIKWNFNVGRVHIRIFEDNGVEFVQDFAIFPPVGIFLLLLYFATAASIYLNNRWGSKN